MKDFHPSIVVIGSGKAALFHLAAYLRLFNNQNGPEIYIIAGEKVDLELTKIVKKNSDNIHFITLADFKGVDPTGMLVDICTPSKNHKESIEQMVNAGFVNFLVEKPLVTTPEDLQWIQTSGIRILVMENYKFSKATQRAIELIGSKQILPDFMASFFCKNRTLESIQMRGFSDTKPPHVFTIELPHQIYLATFFLGPAKVLTALSEPMKAGDIVFAEHGSGSILLDHSWSGPEIITKQQSAHFSCLSSDKKIRRVIIFENEKRKMIIDYPLNKRTLNSRIVIYEDGKLVLHEKFANDDMIKTALSYYYSLIFKNSAGFPNHDYNLAISDSLLLIDALLKSSKENKIVDFSGNACMNCQTISSNHSILSSCKFK